MCYSVRGRTLMLAVGLFAAAVGCRRAETPSPAQPPSASNPAGPAASALESAAHEEEEAPPPPPTIPEVKLTETLAATCLVKVGDAMPDGELPDLEDKQQSVHALFGEQLTVICFWQAENIYAVEELRDLATDVAEPYAEKGVRVIGINEGDSTEAIRAKLDETHAKFPNLQDVDGQYFVKVATEKTPRTYLLDAEGKILWFDVEYSRSTRRDLLEAIQVALGEI